MGWNGKGAALRSAWLYRKRSYARMDLTYLEVFASPSQVDSVVWRDWFFAPGPHPVTKITQFRAHLISGRRYGSFAGKSGSGGPHIVAVGQATETDTAQTITKAKTKAISQVLETDTAWAITKVKSRILNQVLETDTAQPLSKSKIKIIGQVVETDVAQAITKAGITVSVGQVVETDVAQVVLRLKVRAIGQVLEADTAQVISEVKSRTLGQVVEIDTAQLLSKSKVKAVGQALETDTAQPITRSIPGVIAVGQVLETDTAFPITVVTIGIGGGGWRENRKRKPWPLPPPTFPLEKEEEEKELEVQAPENKTAPHWLDRIEKKPLVTPRGLQYRPAPIEIEEIKQVPPAVKTLHIPKTSDDSDEALEAALSLKRMIRRRKEERIIYELIAQGKLQ